MSRGFFIFYLLTLWRLALTQFSWGRFCEGIKPFWCCLAFELCYSLGTIESCLETGNLRTQSEAFTSLVTYKSSRITLVNLRSSCILFKHMNIPWWSFFFFEPCVNSYVFIWLALCFLSPDMTCAWHGAILHSVLVLSVLMLQKKLIVWEDWLITVNVAIVKQSSMTLMVCLISYW